MAKFVYSLHYSRLLKFFFLLCFYYLDIQSEKVVVIGAGNFGTAIANRISLNTESRVDMWIYDEIFDGKNLSDVINETHENQKYLPGIKLSENVVATTDVSVTIDADYIVLVVPHQYITSTLRRFSGKLKSNCILISMTKGLKISEYGPELMSKIISKEWKSDRVAVVMGPNLANDVALNYFVEATVACEDLEIAKSVANIFNCSCFRTQTCTDVSTVELCGALKNIIALGSGKTFTIL